ncbi:extracellular solute-binding protein [Ktedonobacteria bacterium brp13]|nr:extracellular solute-binding protein [Ktedonobacteria bacterium brp13]
MDQEQFRQNIFNRRNFLRGAAGTSLGLMASSSLLAACGGGSTSNVTNAPVTIKLMNAPDPKTDSSDYSTWMKVIQQITQKNPQYKYQLLKGGYDATTFYTQFAAGQAPDVIQTFFTEPQSMIARGAATDINALFHSSQYANIFAPGVLDSMTGPNGHIYGLPYGTYELCLFYNRSVFQEAGLDPNKPPLTWDDYRQYAKRIADKTNKTGSVECSSGGQGGWRFVNWLYSNGGSAMVQQNGKWTATINTPQAQDLLQFFSDMRFTDRSMQAQTASMQQTNTADLVASGKVGMTIAGAYVPGTYYTGKGSIDFLGLGPMPQNGGNAALGGGNVWVFNSKSSSEVIKAGFEWATTLEYDLGYYEANDKALAAANKAVGMPLTYLYTGSYSQQIQQIDAKYVNVPTQNYAPYVNNTSVHLKAEPPQNAQQLYSLLDVAMQDVFTNPHADISARLANIQQTFQTRYLDALS